MGSAKDATGNQEMQCQSCHGTLSDVGSASRTGWLDEPNCQACHQNGNRYTSALQNGTLRNAVDTRFATNPNTPQAGVSMYRYSTGHGKLQCSACHGSTHAIFPTSHLADNLQSISVQGHSGTIAECTSCHATMPSTTTGGPHGMHTVGQDWVSAHKHVAENNSAQCKACHGSDYRGSALSKTFSARTLTIEHGTKSFAKGHAVSCYDCHNGPNP
jgi:cytochrome c1